MNTNQNQVSNGSNIVDFKTVPLNGTKSSSSDVKYYYDDERRKPLHTTIEDFYQMGNIIGPVKTVTDLLYSFFSTIDPDSEDDAGNLLPNSTSWGSDYTRDLVYTSTEMIKFFIQLKENWDKYPENPNNNKSQSTKL